MRCCQSEAAEAAISTDCDTSVHLAHYLLLPRLEETACQHDGGTQANPSAPFSSILRCFPVHILSLTLPARAVSHIQPPEMRPPSRTSRTSTLTAASCVATQAALALYRYGEEWRRSAIGSATSHGRLLASRCSPATGRRCGYSPPILGDAGRKQMRASLGP